MPWITSISRPWALRIGWLVALLLALGCSTSNTEAPADDQAHESDYIVRHAGQATTDSDRCQGCHGSDWNGGDQVTSCFQCHENSLPFTVHTIPYSDPNDHGEAARNDQTRCLTCHGTAPNVFDGGILSDPDLYNKASANCSSAACHPDAGAHPTRWTGNNDITGNYSASHQTVTQATIDTSCALCHQVASTGSRPLPQAPSCFAAGFTNGDNVFSSCHPGGAIPDHGTPYTDPNDHGPSAKADLSECQVCHGTPGTIAFDGGSAPTACSAAACHPDAGAHPTNWADNDTTGYISTHTNAGRTNSTCIICHDVTEGRTAPNSAAPSCFSIDFTNTNNIFTNCHPGGAVPVHGIPYTDPNVHGGPAKSDLAECQGCHGTPGTIFFDGGTASTACSSIACHPVAGAHPAIWRSGHRDAGQLNSTCTICHDVIDGRTAPNNTAPSCYDSGWTNDEGDYRTCHEGGWDD